MAKVHCAISGLRFNCDYSPITITANDGYYHPIFALPYRKLYGLYSKHCSGHLTNTDSYLLFLAFLHSTEQITWKVPALVSPNSPEGIKLVEFNLKRLIEVIESSNVIQLPSFNQPSFVVDLDTCTLHTVPTFIYDWEQNIVTFKRGIIASSLRDRLDKVERKLSWYIKSGESVESYTHVVANWADKVAGFPKDKQERWCKIIRSCFNSKTMFYTPLSELKAIKAYCEENIEPGSIHSHTLFKVIREGIFQHTDFLGMNTIALGYTLLPANSTINDKKVAQLIASAPIDKPKEKDYSSKLDYIKATLKYQVASREAEKEAEKKEIAVLDNKGDAL